MAMQWSNVVFSGSLNGTASSQVIDARGYTSAFLQVFSPLGGPNGVGALRGTSVSEDMISPSGVAGKMVPAALQTFGTANFTAGTWATAGGGPSIIVIPTCYDFLQVVFTQTGGTAGNVIAVLTLQD